MTKALAPVAFCYDHADHVYSVAGMALPHITGMLQKVGLIDDTWFTEESSLRGTAVHDLTAAYDLGALDARSTVSKYRGYLLAHIAAMKILRPTMLAIEEPDVHPRYRYGGRPDRVLISNRAHMVLEIKSGVVASEVIWRGFRTSSQRVQTALQAILVSWRTGLPAHNYQRAALHLKDSGRYDLRWHRERTDVDAAMLVIKECCI